MENVGNLSAEASALAMILRDKKVGRELLSLPTYFFSDPLFKSLYEHILERHTRTKKIPTLATISSSLDTIVQNKSDAARLEKLLVVVYHADIESEDKGMIVSVLKKSYQARQLNQAQLNASQLLAEGKLADACNLLGNTISSISYEDYEGSLDTLGSLLEEVEEKSPAFIPTGIRSLDAITGGFAPGELIVVSAPRGSGKSTLMLQFAVNSYRAGRHPVYINLEMARREWTCRLFSNITQLPYTKIRKFTLSEKEKQILRYRVGLFFAKDKNNFKEWFTKQQKKLYPMTALEYYEKAREVGHLTDDSIVHIGKEGKTIAKLAAKLHSLKRNNSCDIVLLDYLSWLESGPTHYKVHERLSEAAKRVKGIATDLDIPIVVATHVTDDGEVKYSRGVEEHADQVMVWKEKREDQADPWRFTPTTTKSRNSALCSVYLEAYFSKMSIHEVPGTYDEESNEELEEQAQANFGGN